MKYFNFFKIILPIVVLIIFVIIYKTYNPVYVDLFPKCPFLTLTGYKCPGCGSQRAIHYLLNFDVINASKYNILLVISIPYLILGYYFEIFKPTSSKLLKLRNWLYGLNATIIVFVIIVLY